MRISRSIVCRLGGLFLLLAISAFADEMVRVTENFCIDKYEASVPPAADPQAVSVPDVLPKVNITQVEAAEACAAAGKRLCTDAEWLRACKSAAGLTYPYGNTLVPGRCNAGEPVDPNGTISNTGSHLLCVTAEGALDMAGNVNEWTDDPFGTFRGGSYIDSIINGPGCSYATTAHNTAHKDDLTGFRCCADTCISSMYVQIDIKPGSDPNCVNVNDHGVIPVAILGTPNFDVAQIDTETLFFGGLELRVRGKKGPLCQTDDVNSDGYADLVCHFEDDASSWTGGETTAELEGSLVDGTEFTGSGPLCIVPKKNVGHLR